MRSSCNLWTVVLTVLCMGVAATVLAAVPGSMNFQGLLTNASGQNVDDGLYNVRFTVYDATSAGTVLWAETLAVSVTGGLFTVELGQVHPFSPVLFSEADRWVGVALGADPELTPRTHLTSVAYAMNSASLGDGAWTVSGDNVCRLSGYVGIGTPSPSERLVVQGATDTDGRIATFVDTSLDASYITLGQVITNLGAYVKYTVSTNTLGLGVHGHQTSLFIKGNPSYPKVGIGTSNPQGALDISSPAGGLIVPRMTTAQRDALAGVNGTIVYNTNTNRFNFYENGAWVTK